MNKHTLPVIGFSLLLLITSCKKTDVQQENNLASPAATTVATASSTASVSDWKTLSNWNSSKSEKFTSYNAIVEDSSISNAVAGAGLVLAFVKNGNTVSALPFEEKGSSNSYTYYQVARGSIIFSSDVYSGTSSMNAASFKYFVFSPEQLKDLEAKGHSKAELLQLSYEGLTAVVNK